VSLPLTSVSAEGTDLPAETEGWQAYAVLTCCPTRVVSCLASKWVLSGVLLALGPLLLAVQLLHVERGGAVAGACLWDSPRVDSLPRTQAEPDRALGRRQPRPLTAQDGTSVRPHGHAWPLRF